MLYTVCVATDRNQEIGVVIPDSMNPLAREQDK